MFIEKLKSTNYNKIVYNIPMGIVEEEKWMKCI